MIIPKINGFMLRGKAGNYTYQIRRNKQVRYSYTVPSNPQSGPQQAWRAEFTRGTFAWNNLSQYGKDWFTAKAKSYSLKMTGFNYFMSLFLKRRFKVIKNIYRGFQIVNHGVNNITIPSVDLAKSVLSYNCFLASADNPSNYAYGIEVAYLSSSTNIWIKAWDTLPVGNLLFAWEVIEYF